MRELLATNDHPAPAGAGESAEIDRPDPGPVAAGVGISPGMQRSRIRGSVSTICGRFGGIAGVVVCAAAYVASEGPERSTLPGAAGR